jgi:hypothetical protein
MSSFKSTEFEGLSDFVVHTYVPCEVILFHKGFVANLAFPFLFVLVVHIVTPQTAEAVEKFPTNYVTTRIEQVQDKKKTLTGQRRNTITTSYVSILRLSSFYLYKLQTI